MSEPRPIIYVRSSTGGRDALWLQEHRIRALLESVEISTSLMHVYSDLDSPGDRIGGALGWLLREADMRSVGMVILRDFSRLGHDANAVLHILERLERGGARVLIVGEILRERGLQERLRAAVGQHERPRRSLRVATRADDVQHEMLALAAGAFR
jgi:DNA invertase Pin-like site-specific DNA recombinase